jgi:hypothetical protein
LKGEPIGPDGVPERFYAAVHEAGHAVISRVLCGFSSGGAELEIVPGNVVGQDNIPYPSCIARRWALSGKSFSREGVILAEIVIFCAGTEAEKARYRRRNRPRTLSPARTYPKSTLTSAIRELGQA